jgi:hypothetical protein
MLLPAALSLLLAAGPAAAAPPPDPARAELEEVAARIEQLKARKLAGDDVTPELERLLVRAQDLVQRLERAGRREAPPPVTDVGLPPEELRERADALRDERDRVAADVRELDARIEAVRRERRVEAGLESLTQERALFGDPGASRVSPKAPQGGGPDGGLPEPGELLGPRAGEAEEKPQGTALQRLDRLRAERARLVARQAALDAEAAALDAEAKKVAGKR